MSYGYADIYRLGGSSVQFSLIIWNANTQDTFEMILATFQAADRKQIRSRFHAAHSFEVFGLYIVDGLNMKSFSSLSCQF